MTAADRGRQQDYDRAAATAAALCTELDGWLAGADPFSWHQWVGRASATMQELLRCGRPARRTPGARPVSLRLHAGVRAAAEGWLASQPEGDLRVAREIITRREALRRPGHDERHDVTRRYEEGMIAGLRLALSYLGERPGDISQAGAEGYISDVEIADEMATPTPPGGSTMPPPARPAVTTPLTTQSTPPWTAPRAGEPARVVEYDEGTRAPRPGGRVFPVRVETVGGTYTLVTYDDPALNHRGKQDQFFTESGWRAWDGELRWRLEPATATAVPPSETVTTSAEATDGR